MVLVFGLSFTEFMKVKPNCLVLIGKKIKTQRKLKNLSQEEVALRCGMGLASYGRIERGEQNTSLVSFLKIAKAINAEVYELIPPIIDLINNNTDNYTD